LEAVKSVVVDEPLTEVEVHPPEVYRELVELSVRSAAELRERTDVDCPGCGSADRRLAFAKHGYPYWSCRRCHTLFASPRPTAAQLAWYLRESPAARFRARDDFRGPLRQRNREVAAVHADWLVDLLAGRRELGDGPVVDLEPRSPELLEALAAAGVSPLLAVDPLGPFPGDVDGDGADGTPGRVGGLGDLAGRGCRAIAAFGALEHAADPGALARAAAAALAPGGLLALTTRSASGFDIQLLWDRCPTIFPADHLNLLTVEGARALLEGAGFEIVEMSTPGQLDVEVVERGLGAHGEPAGDGAGSPDADTRFFRYFFAHRDRDAKARLQHFLQQQLLSSHLRILARKRRSPPGRKEAS
jgi:ribosomal protein L37AE/L43A